MSSTNMTDDPTNHGHPVRRISASPVPITDTDPPALSGFFYAHRWPIAAMVLGVLLGFASCSTQPASAMPAPISSKAIPPGVCPDGHLGMWVAPEMVQCFKELF